MRTTVPLMFGAGIDRATGRSSASPSSFVDLRNVWLEDARLRMRQGFGPTGFPALAAGTDVAAVCMLEATLDIIFVLYERSTRKLSVARLNPITSPTMQTVGDWGTVNASATLPPVVTWAESYGLLFLAHAEPVYAYRLPTKIYTPNATDATVGALTTLQSDLNGDTSAADVYFRGVYSWNDSLVGYGYGEETSTATANRPEVVRVSKPADPTKFVPEAYFIAGKRSTPVTGLAGIPNVGLVVGKTTSAYLISGTDAETYGINPLDPHHGNISDRGMVAANGAVWMWGLLGPRVTTGGPTIDMAGSLSLDTPPPATLPDVGDAVHMFALYDLTAECVEFVWPRWVTAESPTLSYVASVREPTNIRWSYHTRQACIPCAATVLLGKASPPALTAYADFTAQADAGIDTNAAYRKVSVTWNNSGTYLGTESLEVYVKPAGGSWSLKTTLAHNGASTQSATLTGFDPLQDYSIAIRATRDGGYTSGYASSDPDSWSAGTAADSKTTVQTGCSTPTMTAAVWSRVSASQETIAVSFTLADVQAPFVFEKSTDNASWSVVATYATAPVSARSVNYNVGAGESATTLYFRVTPKRGSITGTSATGLSTYVGPGHATHGYAALFSTFERFEGRAHFVWDWQGSVSPVARNVVDLQVQFSTNNATWTTLTAPWGWEQITRPYYQYESVGLVNPGTNYFRWRSVVTSYGVTNYTPWQTLNWVGVDASVTPTYTGDASYAPGFVPWSNTRTMSYSGTCAGGQTHAYLVSVGSAMRFAEVKSGNGSAQTFTIAPSTVGVSTWDASVSVRYLVRQSDGGGARAQLGFFTEPGGTP